MGIKSPEVVISYLENLTYKNTQLQPDGVDLTVTEIHKITSPGSVDFGGGEYEESEVEKVAPNKRAPDDKYGWWTLSEGEYLIKYNEHINLSEGDLGIIQTKSWLIRNGSRHPTLTFTNERREEITSVLFVGSTGVKIKENARVSKLTVIEK